MKQQSKYDMICFDSRCVAAKRQLFNSSDKDSQSHYDQSHQVECIIRGSPFFRSINTQAVDLPLSRTQLQTRITELFSHFLSTVTQLIQKIHARQAAYIDSLYVLVEKGLNFNNIQPHLSTQTSNTDLLIEILNLKFKNRAENIKEYLAKLPKTLLSKLNRKNKRIVKKIIPLLLDDQPNTDIEGETDTTYDLKQILSQLPEKERSKYQLTLAKIEQKPAFELKKPPLLQTKQTKLPTKPKEEEKIQKLTTQFEDKNKRFQRNPALKKEIYSHIAQQFVKSEKMGYRYFPQKLREIIDLEEYRYFESEVVLKVYKGIKGFISINFHERDRRYSYHNSEFKKYKRWMTDSQIQAFKRCILKFSGVNPEERLLAAEVYHVYIVIMVHMAKVCNKPLSYVHPKEHLDLLDRKILYLYFTLESLEKVNQLLSCAYPKDPEVTPINVMHRFKKVLLETLNKIWKINERQQFYIKLKELMEKEKDIGGLEWKQVVLDLSEYYMTQDKDIIGKLSDRIIRLMKQKQGNMGNMGASLEPDMNSYMLVEKQRASFLTHEEQSQAYQSQQRSRRRQRMCNKINFEDLDVINDSNMHEEEDFHEIEDSSKNDV